MTIERCEYEDVAHLRSRAAREGASVKPSMNTQWFAVRTSAGEVVGCGAVLITRTGARVKAVWLDRRYRGQGWGRSLMDALMLRAQSVSPNYVEVIARYPAGWRRYGLQEVGVRPNGGVVFRDLREHVRVGA